MEWIETGTGHTIAIVDSKIVARNAKGKELSAVPPAVKKTEAFEQLDGLLTFLHNHDTAAGEQVERWVLRSLPVPAAVLAEVWADEAWRSWLTDLVIATPDGQLSGFLRGADERGQHVIDLDGETTTLTSDEVLIPHPATIADLDELRDFATELGISQRLNQLFREVFVRPVPAPTEKVTELKDWSGGRFEQLRFAIGRARSAGFKVSGGYAVAICYDAGQTATARYWIGADDPESETETGELHWLIDDQTVPVAQVGPVAYSEGVRMAAHIYAGRKVEEDTDA